MQNIYVLDISDIARKYEQVIGFLPESAVSKSAEYQENDDKLRSLGGALLIEAFTANSRLLYNQFNKPYKKEPPFFNVSHSKDKVGIFLSEKDEVGFDIQYIKKYNAKLAEYVFSDEEKQGVKDGIDFAFRWTMKEAAAKCVGTGIISLKEQTLKSISEKTFTFGQEKLYYKNYVFGEYAVSACSYAEIKAKLLPIDCEFIFKTLAKR